MKPQWLEYGIKALGFVIFLIVVISSCSEEEQPLNEDPCVNAPSFDLSLNLLNPDFGLSNGAIEIDVEIGSGNYQYSLNDTLYQWSGKFNGLSVGQYSVYVRDENLCKEIYVAFLENRRHLEILRPLPNDTLFIPFELIFDLTPSKSSDDVILFFANGQEKGNYTPFDTILVTGIDEGLTSLKLRLTGEDYILTDSVMVFVRDSIQFLDVINGSGTGEYKAKDVVSISADAPEIGFKFEQWTGDTDYLSDLSASSTTLIMPLKDISVTAEYEKEQYVLEVISGTGGGTYDYQSEVNISANALGMSQEFDRWIGDVQTIKDVFNTNTSVIMPAYNISVEASYKVPEGYFTLVVKNGSGSGSYLPGTIVNVTSDAPPFNHEFVGWSGDISFLSDPLAENTTLTMPTSNVAIEPKYSREVKYSTDIVPILNANCNTSGCHDGASRYSDLTTYQNVKSHAADIKYFVQICYMPPSGCLSDEDVERIVSWIDAGAPNN